MPRSKMVFVLVTRTQSVTESNLERVRYFTFSTRELAQEAVNEMLIDEYFIFDTTLDEEPSK